MQLLPEVKQFFERFIQAVTATVRAIVQAVAKHYPALRAIVEREDIRRKRIKQLSYRKKRSQAKNWRKWRKRRRRRPAR
ncbi:hypothetical protein GE107_07175 [Cohnella sp. CFH 77786]|uniref:hypothetical protein n=1 Tax=Cohnella sp. CFH 77786 TaxID=2662265 RepID=UPI001C60C1D5|nr:hypothetical protein [Cohnella sp. CFH 77786]MBW5445840.1 hypothetical protein [Cohnella sp. CFH 77786]